MSTQLPPDALTTRDGIRVEPGQVWRDCDQRMSGGNRKCRVIEVDEIKGKALMQNIHSNQLPTTWISVRRMHKTSTGWEIVK